MGKLKVLDLFSGIGGFSLGLERTGGFETVAFCEIDPFCRRVLAKHWPDVPCFEDVTTLRGESVGPVDVICGGFPCQDISLAGLGEGLDGARSGLWSEIARLVGEIGPGFVLVENVAALLGRGLGRVLRDLAALGYDAEWHSIPVGRLGAPHERDRVWIVAYPNSGRGRADIAGWHDADRENARRSEADRLLRAIPQPNNSWHLANSDVAHGDGQRRRKYHRAEVAVPSEVTGLAGPLSHDGWDTPWPRFLESICRVDDGLRGGLDKAGFAHLGNALAPQIPELIGNAILESMRAA